MISLLPVLDVFNHPPRPVSPGSAALLEKEGNLVGIRCISHNSPPFEGAGDGSNKSPLQGKRRSGFRIVKTTSYFHNQLKKQKEKLFFLLFSFLLVSIPALTQQTVGIFLNDSASFNGYTLFAPVGSLHTFLIDNCGNKVHSWTSNYRPGLSVYLLENGNLLRTGGLPNPNFSGGGSGGRIELMDWDGSLLWGYNYSSADFHQHHDIEYLPNGNILVLAWERRSRAEAIASGIDPATIDQSVWSEQVVELQPIGTDSAIIVWEWKLWDHLIQEFDSSKSNFGRISDHPELVDLNYWQRTGADRFHINSVDYHPGLDQIMLSVRNYHELWVIDHSTTTAEAASHLGGDSNQGGDLLYRYGNPEAYGRGSAADQVFFEQHDTHWIPEGYPDAGKILLYNNGLGRPEGNYSSVEILDPPLDSAQNYFTPDSGAFGPDTLFWSFVATDTFSFYSPAISGAQRLPNGNTLICEGGSGHFFEIDRQKMLVWDYVNPIEPAGPLAQGIQPLANNVFRSYRYGIDFPAFTGRDLAPEGPLELNPLSGNCMIFDSSTLGISDNFSDLMLYPNPIGERLFISLKRERRFNLRIFNIWGEVVFETKKISFPLEITTSDWSGGVYFLEISDSDADNISIHKILKI